MILKASLCLTKISLLGNKLMLKVLRGYGSKLKFSLVIACIIQVNNKMIFFLHEAITLHEHVPQNLFSYSCI